MLKSVANQEATPAVVNSFAGRQDHATHKKEGRFMPKVLRVEKGVKVEEGERSDLAMLPTGTDGLEIRVALIQALIPLGSRPWMGCCNKPSRLWSGRGMLGGNARRAYIGGSNRLARSTWRIRSCASSSRACAIGAPDRSSRCRPMRGSSSPGRPMRGCCAGSCTG